MAQPDNGIRVPKEYEHLMKKEKGERDTDYRIACIRDFVKENPGKAMTYADFNMAAYGHINGGAAAQIKKLRKQGRLTRTKIQDGTRGLKYTYVWHEQRVKLPEVEYTGPRIPVPNYNPKPVHIPNTEAPSTTLEMASNLEWLTTNAKEFAWSNNSDSLREFIKQVQVGNSMPITELPEVEDASSTSM